jgi:uncharacterized protein YecE (DUF72 family)
MLYAGTSGWQYRHWKDVFYPPKVPQRAWLGYFAQRFQTTEVNNTFYNLPEPSVFEQWEQTAPAGFVFALKMSRFLSHLKRLSDPEEPVARFMERARRLGQKLGPILIQLPPSLRADAGRLRATLSAFPSHQRVAVEFRHESWFVPEIRAVLEEEHAALCLQDGGRGPRTPAWDTAGWGYVRFHHGRASPASSYGRDALGTWVRRLSGVWPELADLYAYFNNDWNGCALRDAIVFAEIASASGFRHSRVPSLREVQLAASP